MALTNLLRHEVLILWGLQWKCDFSISTTINCKRVSFKVDSHNTLQMKILEVWQLQYFHKMSTKLAASLPLACWVPQHWADEGDVGILHIWKFWCGIQREDLGWLRNTRCAGILVVGLLEWHTIGVPYQCRGILLLVYEHLGSAGYKMAKACLLNLGIHPLLPPFLMAALD